MPAADETSYTGGPEPLVTLVEDLDYGRRRLRWLLPDGSRAVTTIRKIDDTPQLRAKLAAHLLEPKRLVIRGGEAVEG